MAPPDWLNSVASSNVPGLRRVVTKLIALKLKVALQMEEKQRSYSQSSENSVRTNCRLRRQNQPGTESASRGSQIEMDHLRLEIKPTNTAICCCIDISIRQDSKPGSASHPLIPSLSHESIQPSTGPPERLSSSAILCLPRLLRHEKGRKQEEEISTE
jgi:hypothetical protein